MAVLDQYRAFGMAGVVTGNVDGPQFIRGTTAGAHNFTQGLWGDGIIIDRMRAIILAAGIGKRLGDGHRGPKSLLRFGDRSLLARHVEALRGLNIDHVAICVGHEAESVRAEVRTIGAQAITTTLLNPAYREGSIISLWTMRHYLASGGEVLVMDADVLCDPALLARLANSGHASCFLLDRDFEAGDEPVKLCIRDGLPVEFRKQLAADLRYDFAGESVGFFRFSEGVAARLAQRCQAYVDAGRRDEPYEEAIRDLIMETPADFGFEDITGLPWVEIDFPDDVERAHNEILPRLPA